MLPAEIFATAIRSHCAVENENHWVRDVTLAEDASRIRDNPGVMARLRSQALNTARANGVENIAQALWSGALDPAVPPPLKSVEQPWARTETEQHRMSPRISIAMAAFNGEKHLAEQLESFSKQTLPPNELVISDDNSCDKTVEIIESFKARAKFEVRLFRNENRIGYTANFGKAISECTGDIIFLSDQDDVWFPAKIQKVCKLFEENAGVHCVVNDMELTDASLEPYHVTQLSLIRRQGSADTEMIAGCGTAITRQWRNFILPLPSQIPYDSWIGGLAQRLGVFHLLEETLQYYRRHGANTSNSIYSRVHARKAPLHPYFIKWLKGEAPHNFEAAHGPLAIILERLKERRSKELLDFVSENTFEFAIQTLERELTLIERRAEVVARPRWARIYPVICLLLSGEYERASGALSALKDVVGPKRANSVWMPSAPRPGQEES